MTKTVEILDTESITHDVRRFTVEKPEGYEFEPGQATEVAVDKDGWRDEAHPFTFTSLNSWPVLEFTIKIYPERHGLTEQIGELGKGDRFIIGAPWGAIHYGGKGCFIAGGAGITPFIAILRDLEDRGELEGNRLIFSNKTERDIILRREFEEAEGLDCLFTVTDEPKSALARGLIDRAFLERHIDDLSQHFYVCGPPKMVEDISAYLRELGADPDALIFEE